MRYAGWVLVAFVFIPATALNAWWWRRPCAWSHPYGRQQAQNASPR